MLNAGAGLRVAVWTAGGHTNGFFPSLQATFELRRLADGSAYLAANGQPPEIISSVDLPGSARGERRVEFGANGRGNTARSEWFTLGLPRLPRETPFATFTVSRLQLRVRA